MATIDAATPVPSEGADDAHPVVTFSPADDAASIDWIKRQTAGAPRMTPRQLRAVAAEWNAP